MCNNALKRFLCVLHINRTTHVILNPCEARYGRPRRIFEAFGGDAEPHCIEANGDVVRAVQGDCGVHALGVAAVARQCGPD